MDKIIKQFDCMNEEHVMWLKSINDAAHKLSDGKSLWVAINNNPFGYKIENTMDIPGLHMTLATKYTGAVLQKQAWVP